MIGFTDKISQADHRLPAYVLEILSSIKKSLPFAQQTPIRQPLLSYFFLYCTMLNEVDEADLFEDDNCDFESLKSLQNLMDTAKTIDLTCLCIQINNTVFFPIIHTTR